MANLLSSILNGAKSVASALNNASTTPTVNSTATQAAAPTAYDPTAQINALKQAQIQQNIANLGAKRDTALSSLNAEQNKITPAYYDKRNQTSTASQMQAKNFSEYMANRGLTNSGSNAQAELTRNNVLQGNIGSLNKQELEANQDVERRRTDVNNTYASDLAAAQAGIEANAMDKLISAQQQAYTNQLNQYNTDRAFNYNTGRDTVSDNRYNTQYADSRADVNYNRNYQTNRDSVADTRYNTEYADNRADVNYNRNYQTGRDTVLDTRYNNEFDYQKSQDSLAQNNWQQQFDYTKLSDSQKMALNQAQFDFQKEQAAIDNTYRQGTFEYQKAQDAAQLDLQRKQMAITQSNAANSQALNREQFEWSRDSNNPDNQYKQAQIASMSEKSAGTPTYKDTLSQAQKLLGTTDSYGNKSYSNDQIVNYVKYSSLSDEEKVQVLNQLGIPNN